MWSAYASASGYVRERRLPLRLDGVADRHDPGSLARRVGVLGQPGPEAEPDHTEPKVFLTHASNSCT